MIFLLWNRGAGARPVTGGVQLSATLKPVQKLSAVLVVKQSVRKAAPASRGRKKQRGERP